MWRIVYPQISACIHVRASFLLEYDWKIVGLSWSLLYWVSCPPSRSALIRVQYTFKIRLRLGGDFGSDRGTLKKVLVSLMSACSGLKMMTGILIGNNSRMGSPSVSKMLIRTAHILLSNGVLERMQLLLDKFVDDHFKP